MAGRRRLLLALAAVLRYWKTGVAHLLLTGLPLVAVLGRSVD
ncbi:hypothetical protein ACIBAG_24075 [Streptomyces sp. NPDC051243]